MGDCKFCGKPAGLLRSSHPECQERQLKRERVAQGGRQRISIEVLRAIKGTASFDELETAISEIQRSSFIDSTERNALLLEGWQSAVEHFLEDGLLDATEEHRLAEFQERFALSQAGTGPKRLTDKGRQGGGVCATWSNGSAAEAHDVQLGRFRSIFRRASSLSGHSPAPTTWRTRHAGKWSAARKASVFAWRRVSTTESVLSKVEPLSAPNAHTLTQALWLDDKASTLLAEKSVRLPYEKIVPVRELSVRARRNA